MDASRGRSPSEDPPLHPSPVRYGRISSEHLRPPPSRCGDWLSDQLGVASCATVMHTEATAESARMDMLLDTRPRPHRHNSDMIDNFRQRPEARRPSTKGASSSQQCQTPNTNDYAQGLWALSSSMRKLLLPPCQCGQRCGKCLPNGALRRGMSASPKMAPLRSTTTRGAWTGASGSFRTATARSGVSRRA